MSFSGWLLAVFVFITIIVLTIGIGWWFRNHSHPSPTPPNKFASPLGWGIPVAGPDPDKDFCQLYEFPTSLIDIDNVPTAVPGNPTFNPLILDNLQGVVRYPTCLDPDQTLAQQLQHTCIAPAGVVDGAITRCFLINGGTTGLSGTESFYTDSGCSAVPPCAGELSLVSINFQAPVVPISCIQNEGTGANVTMQTCNPSVPDQLFRVTRIDPGQNPNTLQPGQGQNGLIAQILDRNSGLCLLPGTGTAFTFYDPESIGRPGCSGNGLEIIGENVVMGACTGGEFPGYVWALLPSVSYCEIPGGCTKCGGCQGCAQLPRSNFCGGCSKCSGSSNLITPPQIVYIGNLDLATIPTGMTAYNGLTGSSAIVQWLIDNNALSLYYGGGVGGDLILARLGLDSSFCPDLAYSAQYMSITAYNTISQEAVCYADDTLGTQFCTGL